MRRNDEGYGLSGNPAKYHVLNDIMDKDSSTVYREQLKKEDKAKYEEYLKYEEARRKW